LFVALAYPNFRLLPAKLKIKVCGMRDAANMEAVAQLPIDYMGFIFYDKSPRQAEGVLQEDVLADLPTTIKKVAVFVDEELDTVLGVLKKYHFDVVQLHGKESPAYCEAIKKAGFSVWKVFSVDGETDFEATVEYNQVTDAFLFDTKSPKHGGTGQKFDWGILKRYSGAKPALLSGGIGPDDAERVKEVITQYDWIMGVDLNSRFELSPGIKNADSLRNFINQLLST
jgi:phosphoribosylanthranilate isomerase